MFATLTIAALLQRLIWSSAQAEPMSVDVDVDVAVYKAFVASSYKILLHALNLIWRPQPKTTLPWRRIMLMLP